MFARFHRDPGGGIVYRISRCQGAEVSVALGSSGHGLLDRRAFDIAQELIVAEDEHPIL